MSNALYGSNDEIDDLAKKVLGNRPEIKTLPVDLPSIKGQRKTKASTITKFLKSEGGFNWGLWRLPSVVKVTAKTARKYQQDMINSGIEKNIEFAETMEDGFIDGNWYGRWDGDHRRHIWKKTFPSIEQFECTVYPVDDVETANTLFVKIQKLNQKGLTQEDTFVNLYYGNDPEAEKIADALSYCGVCVKNSDEGIVPETATNTTPSTRILLFRDSIKKAGLEETKLACDILISALGKNKKWNREISPTLLYGLALVFNNRPATMKNGLKTGLTNYVHDTAKTTPSQKDLVNLWIGPNQHNKPAESLAYGFTKALGKAISGGSYSGNKGHLEISSLRDDLGLNVDDEE